MDDLNFTTLSEATITVRLERAELTAEDDSTQTLHRGVLVMPDGNELTFPASEPMEAIQSAVLYGLVPGVMMEALQSELHP